MGSTRVLVTLVPSLDKTLYDDYLCLVASNKQQIYVERSQTSTGKLGKWLIPKRVRIRLKHSAPSLSRDRMINMHQSIIRSNHPSLAARAAAHCAAYSIPSSRLGQFFLTSQPWRPKTSQEISFMFRAISPNTAYQ